MNIMNTQILKSPIIRTLCLICGVFAAGAAAHAGEKSSDAAPTTYAVLFYADWCNSCKVLDPKIKEARNAISDKPILFLKLDMTDEETKKQAAMLANVMGLEDYYKKNEGKTGFMLLIDSQDKQLVNSISRNDSVEEIEAKFSKAGKA